MIIYCLRHGEAGHNLGQLMNGDPSKPFHLTKLGKLQVAQSAEKLKGLDIIFSSEFPRTIETAEIINKNNNVPIKQDKRLNDLVSGVEGKTYKEYKEQQKIASEIQKVDIYNAKINNGESLEDEKRRIYDFLDEIKIQNYERVLIAAHFDTVCIIHRYAKKLTNEQGKDFRPRQGEIYQFEI